VLVSGLAGRAAVGDPEAARRGAEAWLAYARALRRRLRGAGVAVAVAAPSVAAIRLAARLAEPRLAAVGADRVAELVEVGLRRGRARIAVPGSATVIARALRLVPSRLRKALSDELLPSAAEIADAVDEASPLAGKSASGD
jgi:short-subunit dehydrogenase